MGYYDPQMSDQSPLLSRKQQIYSLFGIYISIFAWGMSFAGLVPLMSLSLESQGYDTFMIGLIGAVTPVGVIIAAPFVPRLVQQLGTAQSIFWASVGVLISVALLPIFDSYGSWLALRFIAGVCGAIPWIVTETWLNIIAHEKNRGRITALYGVVMALSFAIGPFMLSTLGTEGNAAFIFCMALLALSLFPIVFIWRFAPVLHPPEGIKLSHFIWTIPSILAAGALCGFVDMSFLSFLPIWGLRMGFTQDAAILLLSVFVLGNVVLQLPIGWLADKTDRSMVLIGCAVIGVICSALIIFGVKDPIGISMVLFVWGGCVWALYTLSMAILGERYKGGELTAANAAFIVAYEISNIIGPPLSGISIQLWEPHGLIAIMGIATFLFVILSTIRQMRRRKAAQLNSAS